MSEIVKSYISAIKVNAVRHLKNVDIVVSDDGSLRHLILTGPNGSGKTSVLEVLLTYLVQLVSDVNLEHLHFAKRLEDYRQRLSTAQDNKDDDGVRGWASSVRFLEKKCKRWWGELEPYIVNEREISSLFAKHQFVIAYYEDRRNSKFVAPKSPVKPNLNFSIRDNKVDQFLRFLVDLKVQQALARNEGQSEDASGISLWFDSFRSILRRIFNDEALELTFDYKTYEFRIVTEGKDFPFTALSAGYSAALDIVADLILKMQEKNRLVRTYDMPGIVLIDEIETHLHLSLQKEILPILVSLFPNVQFIVTSHSPFVIGSIPSATVYDLKSQQRIENLTEYSYESLAEGVFGVDMASGELKRRLDRIEELVGKESELLDVESSELKRIVDGFELIPDALAPAQKTRYRLLVVRARARGLL